VSREIKSSHPALLPHPLIIQHAMVLPRITTRRMQEQNLLLAFPSLLVEDLALAPHGRGNVRIPADNMVFVRLRLLVLRRRARVGIVQDLEDAAPDVGPVRESVLVALDFDAGLFDVHAEHAPVGLVGSYGGLLHEFLPLLW